MSQNRFEPIEPGRAAAPLAPAGSSHGTHAHTHGHAHDCGHDHSHSHHEHDGHCTHGSLAEHHPRTDAICVDRVSFRYPGSRRASAEGDNARSGGLVLRDVTLHVEQGCNLGIIGPNGAGKTTLLKIMLGQLTGYTGSVSIFGLPPRDACRRGNLIGYVPQRHDAEWRFPVTGLQVVKMGLVGKTGLFRFFSREDREYASHIMQRVGVADLRDRPIGDLSGGQQQRLFIARALVAKPRILVFDEPTIGIDEAGQRQFATLLHELHESLGLTIVIVSHDLQAIAASCNRVACLRQTIHYHDSPKGLTREVLNELFRHDIVPMLAGEEKNP